MRGLLLVLATVMVARADNTLVLPFFNLSNQPDLNWVGESISEAVRTALDEHGIVVLGREDRQEVFRRLSVPPYVRLTTATVFKLGSVADATDVVYGQYELAPGQEGEAAEKRTLRITCRMLNLREMKPSGELLEIGGMGDLASLQNHLSYLALRHFAGPATPAEDEFRRLRPSLRVDAVENHIRGLLAPTANQKIRFFTQAARLDERFATPCFELGRLYAQRKEYRFAPEWLERVKAEDARYAEAQFWLGLSRYFTGDFERAEAAFRAVSERVPLNEVFNNLGAAQSRRRDPHAVDNFQKAIAGDDADPDFHFNAGYSLWKQQRFDEAAPAFRAVLERAPEDQNATVMLGRCLKRSGPRPADPKSDGLERVKLNYEGAAYRQLKAAIDGKRK